MLKPTPIRKSMDGNCALSSSCFPVGTKSSPKRNWLKNKDLYLADISGKSRVVVAAHFITDSFKKTYLMDCITGTLYKLDGGCLTSDSLRLNKFTKQEGLDKVLMKVKSDQIKGDE